MAKQVKKEKTIESVTTTENKTPNYVSTAYVDVELLQAVKIGKFTYRAGRTVGLLKDTADDLIKKNKAKKV